MFRDRPLLDCKSRRNSALRKAQFSPGQSVLIDGATGTLGLGTVILTLAMGATKEWICRRAVVLPNWRLDAESGSNEQSEAAKVGFRWRPSH
jgi:hypothetical protein